MKQARKLCLFLSLLLLLVLLTACGDGKPEESTQAAPVLPALQPGETGTASATQGSNGEASRPSRGQGSPNASQPVWNWSLDPAPGPGGETPLATAAPTPQEPVVTAPAAPSETRRQPVDSDEDLPHVTAPDSGENLPLITAPASGEDLG